MKTQYKLLAFDLDDTALDKKKNLRPEVENALNEAASRGCLLAVATGRMLKGIPEAVMQLSNLRYAITSNGAKIYDLQNGELLYSDCFEPKEALELMHELEKDPCFISIFIDDVAYTPNDSVEFLQDVMSAEVLVYLQQSRKFTQDLETLIVSSQKPVEKILGHYDNEALRAKVRARLSKREDLHISSSMTLNLEINTATANKGNALAFVAEHVHIPLSSMMAVGDSDNDLLMLEKAGFGVAMGSANADVKNAADVVCPPATESGLAEAVKHYLLE